MTEVIKDTDDKPTSSRIIDELAETIKEREPSWDLGVSHLAS
jgi:hypothetical protein